VPFCPVALASPYATARAHRNHYLDKGSKGWLNSKAREALGKVCISLRNSKGWLNTKARFCLMQEKATGEAREARGQS